MWRDFAAWFGRMPQQFKGIDAHQAFEEIRRVIAADAEGVVAPEAPRARRQAVDIPGESACCRVGLFEKYQSWLADSRLFDLNLVAREWTPARPAAL